MTVLLNILFEWAGTTKTHEMHKKQERRCDSPTSETSSINFEPFFLLKIWIWWYPSLTPKNKQTDAWQMSWYLSKYYLLVLFFPLSMQLLTIHHCLWSQLSKCLLNVTQVFKQDVCVCCGDKKATRMWGNGMCVGIWMCEMHTDMCREHYCNLCVCANGCVCVCVCVSVCTRLGTSLIQRGINPIHYLAGLRAAQSMALSVAADELPSLTRCIIQTCRRARLCLAFQSTRQT